VWSSTRGERESGSSTTTTESRESTGESTGATREPTTTTAGEPTGEPTGALGAGARRSGPATQQEFETVLVVDFALFGIGKNLVGLGYV
jgi:hypothetical protein